MTVQGSTAWVNPVPRKVVSDDDAQVGTPTLRQIRLKRYRPTQTALSSAMAPTHAP